MKFPQVCSTVHINGFWAISFPPSPCLVSSQEPSCFTLGTKSKLVCRVKTNSGLPTRGYASHIYVNRMLMWYLVCDYPNTSTLDKIQTSWIYWIIRVKDRSLFSSLDISLDPKPYLKMHQLSPTGKVCLAVTAFTTEVKIISSVLCYSTKTYKQLKETRGIPEWVITYVSLQKGKFF